MHLPLAETTYLGLTLTQWVLLIAGVALVFSIRRWRQQVLMKNRKTDSPPPTVSPAASPLNVRQVAVELQALLAELEETSRRLTAQLDNRYTRLEQLLAEADEKIQRLESLTRQSSPAPGSSPASAPASPAAPGPAVEDAERTLQRLRQERGAPSPLEDPAYQPIYSLADQGKSPRDIAQELGRHPGEIELILALRRRQRVG